MKFDIRELDELPADWTSRAWSHTSLALAAPRLAQLGRDARWSVRVVTARAGADLLGSLAICRPRSRVQPDLHYDLTRLVDGQDAGVPDDARQWLFVGGCRDLGGGALVRPDLPAEQAGDVRTGLFAHAFGHAGQEDLFAAAPYLRGPDWDACAAALGATLGTVRLADTASIDGPYATMQEYLATLSSSRRRKVARDRRLAAEAGLSAVRLDPAEAIEAAAPLVCAVKRRHGIADDPRLAAHRLKTWMAAEVGRYVCFGVFDRSGRLVAASFSCHAGDVLDGHEIGLVDDPDVRLLAYLEASLYAPIAYAIEHTCRQITLGSQSAETKHHRGARLEPVWLGYQLGS